MPKDLDAPEHYEDAFACDSARGLAAIADGVASGIFSRQWADILVQSVVRSPPPLADGERFQQWLAEHRARWQQEVQSRSLSWNQKAKLAVGAYSTLLWLHFYHDGLRPLWQCLAIGDSCFFHIRDGRTAQLFPLQSSAEFEQDPLTIGSCNRQRDHLLSFQFVDGECQPRDWFVLCTDALAAWVVKQHEQNRVVDWNEWWSLTADQWRERIVTLRQNEGMRHDDTTLLLIRVDETSTGSAVSVRESKKRRERLQRRSRRSNRAKPIRSRESRDVER